MIPADDRGLTLGDGLFETILAENGEPRRLDIHLARLSQGCAALGLTPPDPAEVAARAAAALTAAGLGESRAAVRVTWTAGSGGRGLDRPAVLLPRLVVTAAPAPAPDGPARVATSRIARNERSPASRLKTLSYLDNVLARAEAASAGADEALMLNTRGEPACGAAANVFWESGGRLFTPALDCGVLAGTARGRVMALAMTLGVDIVEVRADPDDLHAADAVFLTNSLIGVRQVSHLDGRTCGASRLVETFADLLV